MTDDRDEIRQRTDIVELVGQRVALKRAGRHWKGLCPFHNDKNPSFIVNREMGRYKCWSCGAQGDIFNWVMETQRVDFSEAIRILADLAGVTLSRKGTVAPSRREAQEKAMADALAFFRDSLTKHRDARDYAEGRGLGGEVGDHWEIGYAPDVGEVLASHLQKRGHSLAECKELFLVDTDPGGGFFDKFRGRLIFPIRDERGQLVAFGGRVLGQAIPKYINSSDTPLYNKSKVLYGMHRAKSQIASTRTAVLVEGYLDVIACHRAGVTNAVASLGTSLAEDHVRLLKRWCETVVILYDCDTAGQKAAQRAAELIQSAGMTVRIAVLPEGNDPDTMLRNEGPGAVLSAVERTIPPLDFQIQQLRQRLGPNEEEFWREVVSILAGAPNHLELEKHLLPLASEYPGLSDPTAARSALLKMVTQAKKGKRPNQPAEDPAPVLEPVTTLNLPGTERALFRAFIEEPTRDIVWPTIRESAMFSSQQGREIALALSTAFPENPPTGHPSTWLHQIDSTVIQDHLVEIGLADLPPVEVSTLNDIMARMAQGKERRAVVGLRSDATESDEKLRQLTDRLRALKP